MGIITFTTDLGEKDPYASAVKGHILSLCPDANLVDITHQVAPFNILEGAFILKSAFVNFPEGTIHLVGIDPEGGAGTRGVAMRYKGHYFVAPDNGVLSLIRREDPAEAVVIENPDVLSDRGARSFRIQQVYAPAAAFLAGGGKFEDLGEATHIREFFWGEPSYTEDALRGIIIHIDHFGNSITNIRKEEFLKIKGDRSFQIFIRNLRLQRIVSTYADVTKGEALAIFGESGHLEIAIREGSAAQLLGLKEQDMLTVEFYGG